MHEESIFLRHYRIGHLSCGSRARAQRHVFWRTSAANFTRAASQGLRLGHAPCGGSSKVDSAIGRSPAVLSAGQSLRVGSILASVGGT